MFQAIICPMQPWSRRSSDKMIQLSSFFSHPRKPAGSRRSLCLHNVFQHPKGQRKSHGCAHLEKSRESQVTGQGHYIGLQCYGNIGLQGNSPKNSRDHPEEQVHLWLPENSKWMSFYYPAQGLLQNKEQINVCDLNLRLSLNRVCFGGSKWFF